MVVTAAIGMISCGNSKPASQDFKLTLDNVGEYIETLANYSGREVSVYKETVDEDTILYYSEITFSNQAYSIEGWVADNGDTVIIDYVGKMDDVAFEGGTATGTALLLGSGTFIPGFEEGLIGAKAGDVLDLNLTFPDPYENNPDFSGKECVFTVTVTQVVPGLSDAAIAALNNPAFTTVDEYKAYIESFLNETAMQQYEQEVVQAVIDILVNESVFKSFPDELLNYEKTIIEENFAADASYYGMTVDEYIEAAGSSLAEQEEVYAKEQVVFYSIANDIGVTVTDEDIEAKINEYIDMYSVISSAEDVYTYIASRDLLYESLIISDVFDYLMKVTTVVEPVE